MPDRTTTPSPSAGSAEKSTRRRLDVVHAAGSGLVVGVVLVVMSSSFASLVFSGPMEIHLHKGIGLSLLASVIALVVVGLMSSMRGAIGGAQDVTGAILGLAAASIAAQRPPDDLVTFLTVVLVMGLSCLLTGASFLLLGTVRAGEVIRYVPYPVVGGFLAGTGWLLAKGGIGITTGIPLSWSTVPDYMGRSIAPKAMLATTLAAVLVLAVRRCRHPLLVPAALATVVVVFYAAVFASGSTLPRAEAGGWLLGPFPDSMGWRPWALEALGHADWEAVRSEAATVVSVVVVAVLGLLMNLSGIEMATGHDLDLNRELRAAGVVNLLAGPAGGMPAYHKLSATVLAHALGRPSPAVALVAAGVCALVLAFGASAISLLPRLLLGGLVAFLGLSLLSEWLYDAFFRLRGLEYLTVLVILLVVAGVGFVAGVAVGSAIALALFALDSSRAQVVHAEFTGSTLPSNVDRAPAELAVMRESGDSIHVLRLQGFLFFGTANRLLHRIRDRALCGAPPLRFLVLDFKRVTGMDSSAVLAFTRVIRLARSTGFEVVFTGITPVVGRQLDRGGMSPDQGVQIGADLDRGVQWCEELILAGADEGEPPSSGAAPREASPVDPARPTRPAGPLSAYLEEMRLPEGRVLIREGEPSDDLFFLESGRLTTLLEQPDGHTVRLRAMGPGSVVGEVGLYGGHRRTASVVTDSPSTVLRLSKQALDTMEREDPRTAAEVHKMIATLLAQRLAMTLQLLKVFVD